MGKPPAFQFYANDWLSSRLVAKMSLEQQGAYLRLLCYCWSSGDVSLLDDDDELAALSGLGEKWLNGSSTLVRLGFNKHPTKPEHLTNEKLFDLWKKTKAWKEKCKLAGIASGKSRRRAMTYNDDNASENTANVSSTNVQLNTNTSSSNSYSLKDTCETSFTPTQVGETNSEAKKHKRTAYPDAFNSWWVTYPQRGRKGKKEAYGVWSKIKSAYGVDELQRLVEIYARSDKGRSEYVPHAVRFLKNNIDDDPADWGESHVDHVTTIPVAGQGQRVVMSDAGQYVLVNE